MRNDVKINPAHPLIGAVQDTIEKVEATVKSVGELDGHASNLWNRLAPGSWTKQIEAALNKPADLEALRVQFREESITFLNYSTGLSCAESRLIMLRAQLSEQITALLELYDEVGKTDRKFLKPLLEAVVIAAANAHALQARRSFWVRERVGGFVSTRVYRMLADAFGQLAVELEAIKRPRDYPTGPAVQWRQYRSNVNSDVDMRRVFAVELRDCDGKFPLALRVSELLRSLRDAQLQAEAANTQAKENNGEINEQQHAGRMVDLMLGAGTLKEPQVAINEQNVRRSTYEARRQVLFCANVEYEQLHAQLFESLKASVAEARELIEHTLQSTEIVTVDQPHKAAAIMINCLAADKRLREGSREISEFYDTFRGDTSGGAGRLAVANQFIAVVERHRLVQGEF